MLVGLCRECGWSGYLLGVYGEVRQGVDRRCEDEQLLCELRNVGFDGPVAEAVSNELIRYGWAVLEALMYGGAVFAHAHVLGHGVSYPDWLREKLRASKAGREDIAAEIVSRVFPRYWSDALVGGAWRVDGEASVATYFTNDLLLEFSNVFRVWVRQQTYVPLQTSRLVRRRSPNSRSPV